jgi:ParB family transcriptional regulator, chromosome partitioning protein
MSDTITMIPLSKLQRSDENTRKTAPNAELAEFAASIEAHGLLQNLIVRPLRSEKGPADGHYEVVAGGRRLEALKLLAKRRRIPKDSRIPCAVLNGERADGAVEYSLAENVMREPLHPADQFEAFSTMHAQGRGVEEIAARFGVTPTVVLQRLKLAAVSPRLMAIYREGGMTLEQLTAFTISDDHKAQEHVWFESPTDKSPSGIRRALTRALVEGTDRQARFVGAKAYEEAGGRIVRDLFKPKDEGYFEDSQLLERLVTEKLAAEAENVKAEGWGWVETLVEMDYGYLGQFRHLPPQEVPLTDEEQAKLDGLAERHDQLVAELDDEPDPGMETEIDRISAEIDALSGRETWSEEDKARSGALVSLDYQGQLQVTRGLMKPEPREDKAKKSAAAAVQTGQTAGTESSERSEPPERAGLSEALLEDLSAHRTAALREMLAGNADVALSALLHALLLRTFYAERETCVGVRLDHFDLSGFAEYIGESPAVVAMAERHRSWSEQLPERDELWSWLERKPLETRLDLLAYLTARSVYAVRQRHFGDQRERIAQADTIAIAIGLDMTKWWRPTRNAYFDRVTKQQILAAVSEAQSPQVADKIASMKKDAMAGRAEELLVDTGWLPEPLRPPEREHREPEAAPAAE